MLCQVALEVRLRALHNKVPDIVIDALDMAICGGCCARCLLEAIQFFARGSCFLHLLPKSADVSKKIISFTGKGCVFLSKYACVFDFASA